VSRPSPSRAPVPMLFARLRRPAAVLSSYSPVVLADLYSFPPKSFVFERLMAVRHFDSRSTAGRAAPGQPSVSISPHRVPGRAPRGRGNQCHHIGASGFAHPARPLAIVLR
jgi:hypothetical protein